VTSSRKRGDRPSIRDVAAAAGVSYQTVSRVLNESAKVDPGTRQRVLDCIRAMNYRPSRAAQALGSGRARAVTVVTSNTTLYGYAATLRGIEEAARESGFGVGIRVLDPGSPHQVRGTLDQISDPTAGVVVLIAFDAATRRLHAKLPDDLPCVAAAGPETGPRTGSRLWLGERAAAEEATDHLLTLGHRTVHHVPIPSGRGRGTRSAGWRHALVRAGAPVPPTPAPGWDAEAGYAAGRVLAADPDVTAILCGNDDLAIGVHRALHEAGRSVPAEVSLVGFDDSPPARFLTPALSTVRMDFVALGRACFAAARAQVDGSSLPGAELPEPTLIVRESTGPSPR
jgi:DNA-binding LacI/PurR family transcriptional regulator